MTAEKLGLIDRVVAVVAPTLALRRAAARFQLSRLYDAAETGRLRRRITNSHSPNATMQVTGAALVREARYLDENLDLVCGALTFLAEMAAVLRPRAAVRGRDGQLAVGMNEQIDELWESGRDRLDVAQELPWDDLAHLIARSVFRDGEVPIVLSEGPGEPFRVDARESDFMPFHISSDSPRIVHGVEYAGRRRAAYHLLKAHPGDASAPVPLIRFDPNATERYDASTCLHPRIQRRLGQARGIPLFHSAITRLRDVKQYEESERIAAEVAANLCAVITRGPSLGATASIDKDGRREFEMAAGMVLDAGLQSGDGVEVIDTKRPNNGLSDFRSAMLRAAAAGMEVSASTLAREYSDGSYTAKRAESVEILPVYRRLRRLLVAQAWQPIRSRWLRWMIATGEVRDVTRVDVATLVRSEWDGPLIPYLNPKDEIDADLARIDGRIASRSQVIRERGGDPRQVDREIADDAGGLDIEEAEEPDQRETIAA